MGGYFWCVLVYGIVVMCGLVEVDVIVVGLVVVY